MTGSSLPEDTRARAIQWWRSEVSFTADPSVYDPNNEIRYAFLRLALSFDTRSHEAALPLVKSTSILQ